MIFNIFFKLTTGNWMNDYQKEMFREVKNGTKTLRLYPRRAGATTFIVVYAIWKSIFCNSQRFCFLGTDYALEKLDNYAKKWGMDLQNFNRSFRVNDAFLYADYRYTFVEKEQIDAKEYAPILRKSKKYLRVFTK